MVVCDVPQSKYGTVTLDRAPRGSCVRAFEVQVRLVAAALMDSRHALCCILLLSALSDCDWPASLASQA